MVPFDQKVGGISDALIALPIRNAWDVAPPAVLSGIVDQEQIKAAQQSRFQELFSRQKRRASHPTDLQ
ncbi:uncharacterized protein PHALS_05716 [Plasmopara halstedii]|uniref:Uncharacterized protein n=1 Tax=Plasmopara halstedii TaxID=4781 RepID=A0A0P1B4A1_PLAHL|nr:uncharacterized protein PHALS_05716 [Plasmopara halstedii]CEG48248.1 hypothetical protein PHALS_05716 [Plasmopara halstedii]|eukprot:XP_024584617.1 hypothetical protein PHALS_05716 [Plasmopara halstedii]